MYGTVCVYDAVLSDAILYPAKAHRYTLLREKVHGSVIYLKSTPAAALLRITI